MQNITREQFIKWCQHWGYTEEDGYRAMCFVANIIGENYSNKLEYIKEISHKGNVSELFQAMAETNKDNAYLLLYLYGNLDDEIYTMLEHRKE